MNNNKEKVNRRGISLKFIGLSMSIFAVIVSAMLIVSLSLISYENNVVTKANENYIALKQASSDVQLASDELTNEVRLFVANGDEKYMALYFKEAKITKRRENALETIHDLAEQTNLHEQIHSNITNAVNESMDLMNLEYFAMKLICVDNGISLESYPEVAAMNIDSVAPEDRKSVAYSSVLGTEYIAKKEKISYYINAAVEVIDKLMHENGVMAAESLQKLIIFQTIVITLIVIFVAFLIFFLYINIIRPMNSAIKSIRYREDITIHGNREFNYLADVYNDIKHQNEKVREKLLYEAEHDKLTGIFNRTGYASLYRRMKLSGTVYVLLDADGFKKVNDEYGHEVGDKVLIRIAETLQKIFYEDNSYAFRIGGDEFAVLIENVVEDVNDKVVKKCEAVNKELSSPKGRIPPITMSIGIAHGTDDDTTDSLYKKADVALYKVKQSGKGHVELE